MVMHIRSYLVKSLRLFQCVMGSIDDCVPILLSETPLTTCRDDDCGRNAKRKYLYFGNSKMRNLVMILYCVEERFERK